MNERWPDVERVFEAVVARPAAERAGALTELCGDDEALRAEVESLLVHEEAAGAFLEAPAFTEANMADDLAVEQPLVGRRFGPYTVLRPLGAGAMGEVYRARDERLGRDVALKVLAPHVSRDPDRRARFESEARMLAALNHPHIGAIYGLEDVDGRRALVLELVEGETLAARLGAGRLELTTALAIARQIAEALAVAHERGIIHRDLKPANIAVTGDNVVKVLDFGLAKLRTLNQGADGPPGTESPSPARATRDGMIVGTLAYMSPEQAAGRPADTRSDLWAFGVLLTEMLTGRPVFEGESDADVLAAVLRAEPDLSALPDNTPPPIRRLLRRCLEKDRRLRLDSAATARLEIDDALASRGDEIAGPVAPWTRGATALVVASVSTAMVTALVVWLAVRPSPEGRGLPSRFAILSPPGQPVNASGPARDLALSPDGRYVVYRFGGSNSAGSPLMLRAIDQLDGQPLADVSFAYAPFFSPDSQWVGFFENAQLKKVSIRGGHPSVIGPASGRPLGASWGDNGTIVYATDAAGTGLWRVPADGGQPASLTHPDAAQRESAHGSPSVLPGGRAVLFAIGISGQTVNSQVAVLDVVTGRVRTLVSGSQPHYVSGSRGSAGYLIYVSGSALRAVRFDAVQLKVVGEATTLIENVMTKPNGAANYALSPSGTLVYLTGGTTLQTKPASLVWVDRNGHEEPLKAPARAYGTPRLSPDERRLAVEVYDPASYGDIWIWDFARETLRRLTFDPKGEGMSVWTPDGRQIVFMSTRTGVSNVYRQAADGTGPVEPIAMSATGQWPTSISPDGSCLAGFELVSGGPNDVVFFPLTHPEKPPSVAPPACAGATASGGEATIRFNGAFADFAPNGRYVAYQSNESGRPEVYVRPFPRVDDGLWQVSTTGGTRPVWARNGRELFYLDLSNTLTGVQVSASGPTFDSGRPAAVFDGKYLEANPSRHYDVSSDGKRFLMIKESATGDQNSTLVTIVVVKHWLDELTARVR